MNQIMNVDSDESNSNASSSSNESAPRTTRRTASRLAKKSTAPEPPKPQPVIRRQGTRQATVIANKDNQKLTNNPNTDINVREKRKVVLRKQIGLVYDNRGIHILTGTDLCDCLELECPGCFYPCKKCNSTKCGVECRVNRKTRYESIEYHGYNFVRKNPLDIK